MLSNGKLNNGRFRRLAIAPGAAIAVLMGIAFMPDAAQAACTLILPPSMGLQPGQSVLPTDGSCELTSGMQPVTPTGNGPSDMPAGTDLSQILIPNASGTVTIDNGAGLVRTGMGPAIIVNPIPLSNALANLDSLTVDGVIASNTGLGVVVSQNGDFTLNVGTNPGDTFETSMIGQFNTSAAGSFAVGIGGLGSLYYNPANPTAGDITVNVGSRSGSSGSIVNYGPLYNAGIYVGGTTGNVNINNVHGLILGSQPIFITTSGNISIVNGYNAQITSRIVSTGGRYTGAIAIGLASPNSDPVIRTPASISIVNNEGSTIDGTDPGSGIVVVNGVSTAPGVNTIYNYGRIVGSTQQNLTGAAINFYYKTGTGGITVYNYGEIDGDVALQNSNDALVMRGGSVTGNIEAPTDNGRVVVESDSRLNGGIGSNTNAVNAAEAIALNYNFGELLLKNDATLTVGQNPANLAYTDGVPASYMQTDIATAANGTGAIKFLQATRLTHHVGQANAALRLIELDGGVSTIDTGANGYYADLTSVMSGATLGFGAGGQTLHGNLQSSGAINLGFSTLTISAAGTSTSGNFTALGGSIATSIAGDGNLSGAGSTNLGHIVADGSINIASGTNMSVDTASYPAVSSGARYILASGGSTATLGTTNAAVSGGWTWGLLRGDSLLLGESANDIYLVADPAALAKAAFSSLAGSGAISGSVVDAIGDLANDTGNQSAQLLFGSLAGLTSPADVNAALTKLLPDANGGASAGASSAVGAVSSVVSGHSDNIVVAMADGGETGLSAGDAGLGGFGFWAQPFGFHGDQDRRSGLDGFVARSGGLAAGFDARLADALAAGLALSYGRTTVEDKGALSGDSTRVENYQATLYGIYQRDSWYLESQLAYARQGFDTSRFVAVGPVSENPRGSFNGYVGSARLGGGIDWNIGDLVLVPNASLAYTYMKQDAYSETNAPTAALSVAESSNSSLRSSLGAALRRDFALESGKLQPEIRLAWLHEFHDRAPVSVAQFAFGGSSFTSAGAIPAKDSFAPGLGLTYMASDQLTLSANCDAEIKDRYLGNTGTLKLKLKYSF